MNLCRSSYWLIFAAVILTACKSGPFNLLKPASPHQQYERKLQTSGLNQSTMGNGWITKANGLLQTAAGIKLPYKETGYFAADKVDGASFKFSLVRGQRLTATLNSQSANSFDIYMDIWEQRENGEFKMLAFADSLASDLQLEAKQSGEYILRLQPELLGSGSYTLTLTIGPSLGFPLKSTNRKQIQSFWGVGRDNNSRKHEGIDIFSAFRTPVIAVSEGTVTRVNENNLGGKVVWFRPRGKDYTLYYAHLDQQTVVDGQEVVFGDTLGLMGNTGNAKTTPPHLHFGVYTNSSAVDPLPFVDPLVLPAPKITSDLNRLNATMRITAKQLPFTDSSSSTETNVVKQNTVVRVLAASNNQYKVELPNGKSGYLPSKSLAALKPIDSRKISIATQALLDCPNLAAGVKATLSLGQTVKILGNFENFQLVSTADDTVGWLSVD